MRSVIFAKRGIEPDTTLLRGGWDTITPVISAPPGIIRDSLNFDVSTAEAGGYTRIPGYERFDGRPSPSAASFSLIQIALFENVPTVGQTLTGFTSGATGVIIAIGVNYMAITKVTGSFTNTEVVKVGGTTIGTAVSLSVTLSPLVSAQYSALAADQYRTDIGAVPGSGPVRGVFGLIVNGVDQVFAFRDNVGATATILHKATSGGWTVVPFYHEVAFTAGGASAPAEGATLTQGGVTATIKRVVWQSGLWTGSTAAGTFIITTPSGGSFAAGAATIGAVTVTLSGANAAITFATGGYFEIDTGNFIGASSGIRAYGADGVNRGFEFDGDVLAPISTGFSPDNPKHVKIHAKHLFFSFGSSIAHSAIGFPYKWTTTDGASEIGCANEVTNLISQEGNAETAVLAVTTLDNIHFLYGTGVSNWNKIAHDKGIGGAHYSAARVEQGYWLSSSGILSIRAAQVFGDFTQSTVTVAIPDFIVAQRTKPMFAVVNHTRSQYRLYFNDGLGLHVTLVNGKLRGLAKVSFFDPLHCGWSGKTSSLNEVTYCGEVTGGYVYKMDTGPSFDGEALDAYFTLNPNSMKSPRWVKDFHGGSVEMSGNFYANVQFGYALSYNTSQALQPVSRSYDSGFSGAPLWDNVLWDSFNWDGTTTGPTEVDIRGEGVNIQPTIRCGTNYINSFTISSIIIHYILRRLVR